MTTTVKPEDVGCASAACDYLKDCNGQITGSHLARVAQLFADSREKAESKNKPMDQLFETCGVGYYLPSGVCDHCNTLMKTASDIRADFLLAWKGFAQDLYAIGKASGFYDVPASDPLFNHAEKQLLMVSEIIEGFEGLRGAPWPGIPDDKLTNRPMLEVELADAVIRIMNYASHTGLDVAGAILEKAQFNATRGHRHGGKRF